MCCVCDVGKLLKCFSCCEMCCRECGVPGIGKNNTPVHRHTLSTPPSHSQHTTSLSHLYHLQCQGSLVGLTSDSECEDKKSSASSTGAAEVGRPFPSASPQSQGAVVSSHDYNMEQSNVALLRAELKVKSP
ncbi:hypothetical protein Hamer_G012063, partial [Homarus americanus]